MAIQAKIQEYAKAINLSWHKTTDSVLETARLCAEVEKKFHSDDKDKLFKRSGFQQSDIQQTRKDRI